MSSQPSINYKKTNHIPQESHTDVRKEMEVFQFNFFHGFITQKFRDANKLVLNRLHSLKLKAQFVFVTIKLKSLKRVVLIFCFSFSSPPTLVLLIFLTKWLTFESQSLTLSLYSQQLSWLDGFLISSVKSTCWPARCPVAETEMTARSDAEAQLSILGEISARFCNHRSVS